MSRYPTSRRCPWCGSPRYDELPLRPGDWSPDRACLDCGTRYAPAWPMWVTVALAPLGLLMIVVAGSGIAIAAQSLSGGPWSVPGLVILICAFAIITGIMWIGNLFGALRERQERQGFPVLPLTGVAKRRRRGR